MTRTRTAPMVSVSALALALSAGAAARIDAQWTNAAGGNWNVGTNWSTSPAFPNAAADTATIGLITGATYTVTLNTGVSLAALTLNSADALLSHSAGTLNMNGGMITLTAGAYRLTGGTIANATITGAGLTTFGTTGSLTGVTLDTNLSLVNSYVLNINSGLILNAGRTISLATGGNFTNLSFLGAGDQSLSGGGEVVFDGTSSANGAVRATTGTLVIGAGTTIRSGTQGGAVGNQGSVRNNGTIAARTNARTITATAVTNEASGVLEATNGGTLALSGAWSNAGTFLVDTDGVLNLGGAFGTSSVAGARFDRTGGTVNLTGALANTGNTLALDADTGSFNLNGGTITGGTVTASGGATLNAAGSFGVLSGGVTLDTGFSLINNYELRVNGGLTLNAGRTISLATGANSTTLDFLGAGDQTLAGGGEVVFDGTNSNNGLVRANSGSLVIGAGTTIRSGAQGGVVGDSGSVKNNGTIAARTNARTVTVNAVTNNASGVLEATNGGTLALTSAWSNAGTFLVDTNGVLNLGGSFGTSSVAGARFDRTGGTVNLTGSLANTGNTLLLDADTGSFDLNGGTITGGTVTTSGGAALNAAGSFGVLSGGVTLDTGFSLINNYELRVNGGLTLNAGRTISLATGANFTTLDFLGAGDQTLAGGGEVVFDGSNSNNGLVRANSGSLVIGTGTTVRSGTQGGVVGQSGTVKNDGTIAARTNARTVTVNAVTNNAAGVLEATNGGTLSMAGAWSNAGTLLLNGSTLNLGGSFGTSAVAPARWSRTGGTVNLTGTLTNTGNTLLLNAATGSFNLSGGTIAGGTVAASGGAALNTVGGTSTLAGGVTLDTDLTLVNNATINVAGGLTVNAGKTVSLASGSNFTVLDFLGTGDQSLAGGGDVVFDGTNSSSGYVRANGGALVIGADTTVRTGTQGGNLGQFGTIKNDGTIAARTAARTIVATAVANNAAGVLEATNGATLTMAGAWSNAGTFLLNGSTLNLGGSFGTAAVAPARWSRTGGTVNLTGNLANTGNTLLVNAATGSFNLSGGTITGGTVTTAGGAALNTVGGTSTLAGGLTLDTDLTLVNNANINVTGGLNVNAGRAVSLASGSNFTILDFLGSGDQNLAGGGDVVFDGTNSSSGFVRANAGAIVIGAGTTVRTGTQGGNLGQFGTIKNNGTIAARTNARTLVATAVTNNATGVLEASNGGVLTLAGPWSSAGTFVLDNNPASTLNLGGSFGTASVAPARWSRSGGGVNLTGTLTNTGATLTLNAATGSFRLQNGTIAGGTISGSGGSTLLTSPAGAGGSLTGGVTLDTDVALVNNFTLSVSGGLTINAGKTVSLDTGVNSTVLDFLGAGPQMLTGSGQVVFDGTNNLNGFVRANSGTLVIDTGMTVRSGTQGGRLGHLGALINKGVVSSQTATKTITVAGTTLANEGLMLASNGGTLTFDHVGGLTSNTGADLLARTGGTLRYTAGMNVANNGGFDLEIASASQTLGYGRISITGAASISGSDIDLSFANGFLPDWGDTFHILSFTSLTGDMSTLALPSLTDPTLRWWREQTTSAYRVGVRHIADNNHDGVVDFLDLNRVLGTFGQAGMSLQGDGNEDGVVDFFDLNDVLSLFGQSAPPNPVPAPGALAILALTLLPRRSRR